MQQVLRHRFVPVEWRQEAYEDHPLPIGLDQTISQPYIVAAMTDALQIDGESRVLEIGTGSGYQCAVLAEIAGEVHSVEHRRALHETALRHFSQDRFAHVHLHCADGRFGWREAAPFDAIIATCAAVDLPSEWRKQLKEGGRLVAPVGPLNHQQLCRFQRCGDQFPCEQLMPVRFVPLCGEAD